MQIVVSAVLILNTTALLYGACLKGTQYLLDEEKDAKKAKEQGEAKEPISDILSLIKKSEKDRKKTIKK